ncbi:MAG: hypothetical protein ABH969_06040 [Pseudomonadota bacterium]
MAKKEVVMDRFIDLLSDTVIKPTPEKREALFKTVVGDNVKGEDPAGGR